MVSPTDPDETIPTQAHLDLVPHARPNPGDALVAAAQEDGLPLDQHVLWVADLRGMFGAFVGERHVGKTKVSEYVDHCAAKHVPPVICTVTSVGECIAVLNDFLMQDLIAPVQQRPVGTIPIIIADQHEDLRVWLRHPADLLALH